MNKFFGCLLLVISLFSVRADAQCSMCESLVGIIESWAEANNTITAMESKLDMLCQLVPAFESVCYGIVDFDVKGIVGYLEKNGDSNGVCKKMGLCAGLKLGKTKALAKGGVDQYCGYCEYFFGILETIVESGAGESEVADYLKVVCKAFPSEAICQFGIYNVAPIMIEYFTVVADPSTVCYDFGVCDYPDDDEWDYTGSASEEPEDPDDHEHSAAEESGEEHSEVHSREDSSSKSEDEWYDTASSTNGWAKRAAKNRLHPDDTCTYCSVILNWVRSYVDSETSAEDIKATLETYLCGVTQNLESICDSIFGDFESILTFLEAQESSQDICYELTLCQESDQLLKYMRKEIAVANKRN